MTSSHAPESSFAGQTHDRPESSSFELPLRPNVLSGKLTSLLSTSYADADVREALEVLDRRSIENNPHTRRQLRLDLQKEVIDYNGEIIREFGHVAEVSRSYT